MNERRSRTSTANLTFKMSNYPRVDYFLYVAHTMHKRSSHINDLHNDKRWKKEMNTKTEKEKEKDRGKRGTINKIKTI